MGWPIKGVSVGVASTVVVAANNARRGLVLVNDSDSDIYIARGTAAVVGSGIKLNAGGGTFENDSKKDGLPVDDFNAISTAAAKNLSVTEHLA